MNEKNLVEQGSDFSLFQTLDVLVHRFRSIIFLITLSVILSLSYFFSSMDFITSQVSIKKLSQEDAALFINLNSLDYQTIYEKPPYQFTQNNLINRYINTLNNKSLIENNLKEYFKLSGEELNNRTKNFISKFETRFSKTDCDETKLGVCDKIIDSYEIYFLINKNELDIFPSLASNLVENAYDLFVSSIVEELTNIKIQVEKKANYQIKALSNLIEIEKDKQIKLINNEIKHLKDQHYIAKELNIDKGSFQSVIGSNSIGIGEGETSSEVILQSIDVPEYAKGYLLIEQEIKILEERLNQSVDTEYMINLQSKIENLKNIKSLIVEELSDEITRFTNSKSVINFDEKEIQYIKSNTKIVNSALILFIGFLIAITQAFVLQTWSNYKKNIN